MAIIQAYDSGASGAPAGAWGAFSIESDLPAPSNPREVAIDILPTATPNGSWGLAGWACAEVEWQGIRACSLMTPVFLAPAISGRPLVMLSADGFPRGSGDILGFRAVRWIINDWVGDCRVRVYYIT